jgi:hypothetical protein
VIGTEPRENRIFLHYAAPCLKNISTKGPQNRRSLHGTPHGKPGQAGRRLRIVRLAGLRSFLFPLLRCRRKRITEGAPPHLVQPMQCPGYAGANMGHPSRGKRGAEASASRVRGNIAGRLTIQTVARDDKERVVERERTAAKG